LVTSSASRRLLRGPIATHPSTSGSYVKFRATQDRNVPPSRLLCSTTTGPLRGPWHQADSFIERQQRNAKAVLPQPLGGFGGLHRRVARSRRVVRPLNLPCRPPASFAAPLGALERFVQQRL